MQYIENLLAKYNMTDCKPVATPMDTSVDLDDEDELPEDSPLRALYASLVGSLMFLATGHICDSTQINYVHQSTWPSPLERCETRTTLP